MKMRHPATAEAYAPPATHQRAWRSSPTGVEGRLRIDVHRRLTAEDGLARDVRLGLAAAPKALPPKYFYDDYGSRLFDAICDLPEYYLTRTEQSLLERVADDVIATAQPAELVEFGSGASRKTRLLLDAVQRAGRRLRYLPFDVSEGMLRHAAYSLLREYDALHVHAVVGDYECDLDRLPRGAHRLVLFLGSTIGNFTPAATASFLTGLRRQLTPGEHFLLGVDLVKPVEVLEAAYNDSAGVTAEFNRNVLRVINRALGADFVPERFQHVAFFDPQRAQIEMHLRAAAAHTVQVRALGMQIPFRAGETIHTEISRKFTRAQVTTMLRDASFELVRWYAAPNDYFGLALAHAV